MGILYPAGSEALVALGAIHPFLETCKIDRNPRPLSDVILFFSVIPTGKNYTLGEIPMKRSTLRFAVLLAALAAIISAGLIAAADDPPKRVSLAPYYPTPAKIVAEMLKLGELKPGELHYDLGSGDGRIVIAAAKDFQARSVGFEIDSSLVNLSTNKIAELKLTPLARIEQQDLMLADFSKPDLITTYLLPSSNDKIQPLLEAQMKKGARVVSHDFAFKGWKHQKLILVDDDTDFEVREHYLYLYRR